MYLGSIATRELKVNWGGPQESNSRIWKAKELKISPSSPSPLPKSMTPTLIKVLQLNKQSNKKL